MTNVIEKMKQSEAHSVGSGLGYCRWCYGLNCDPPKAVKVPIPEPVTMTLFGNGVGGSLQMIELMMMKSSGWALIQYDCVLIKREKSDTDICRGEVT